MERPNGNGYFDDFYLDTISGIMDILIHYFHPE